MGRHADLTVIDPNEIEDEIRMIAYRTARRIMRDSFFETEEESALNKAREMLDTLRESHYTEMGIYSFDIIAQLTTILLDQLVGQITGEEEMVKWDSDTQEMVKLQQFRSQWPMVAVGKEEGE